MLTYYDPDEFVSVVKSRTCKFHQIAPGEPYAGCGCSALYGQRIATPEEREANRKAREEREKRRAEAYKAIGVFHGSH